MGSSYSQVGNSAQYNVVTQFGAVGDGVTDCTSQIQAAIDFVSASGRDGTIFFPEGTYLVDGAFRQDAAIKNGYGIAQLILPTRNLSTQAEISISFLGACPPAPNTNWTSDTPPLSTGGSIIKSVKVGASASDAIFSGGPPLAATWNHTGIRANFENLVFRTYNNPKITPLNLVSVGQASVVNCLFDTGTVLSSITQPQAGSSAVVMPGLSNWALSRLINCDFIGYYYGAQWSEHIVVDDARSWLCNYGFQSNGGPHGCCVRRLLAVGCTGTIAFFDQPTRLLGPAQVDAEHTIFGGGRAWQNATVDVVDPGNNARGDMYFCAVLSGTGTVPMLPPDGAANLTITDVGAI